MNAALHDDLVVVDAAQVGKDDSVVRLWLVLLWCDVVGVVLMSLVWLWC